MYFDSIGYSKVTRKVQRVSALKFQSMGGPTHVGDAEPLRINPTSDHLGQLARNHTSMRNGVSHRLVGMSIVKICYSPPTTCQCVPWWLQSNGWISAFDIVLQSPVTAGCMASVDSKSDMHCDWRALWQAGRTITMHHLKYITKFIVYIWTGYSYIHSAEIFEYPNLEYIKQGNDSCTNLAFYGIILVLW